MSWHENSFWSIVIILVLHTYYLGNLIQHSDMRHIEMDIHFIRENVACGQIHIPSLYQIVDK